MQNYRDTLPSLDKLGAQMKGFNVSKDGRSIYIFK